MNQNEWELPPSQGSGSLDDWAIPSQLQPGAQFGAQPSQPASGGSSGSSGGGKRKLLTALAAAVVLALIGGITVFVTTGGKTIAAMSYVSVDDPGPNPFMQSVSDDSVGKKIASGESKTAGATGPVSGSDPNLYGGSGELSVCDAKALTVNLKQDADLNAAFAAGIGINASDVESFIASLSSVVLLQDTWVTNHGYADGKPTPFQAVLQKGTAVLVDSWGVPRVRCSCGNPLAEAWNGYTAPSAIDSAWDGYNSETVATVYGSDEQSESLSLTEVDGTKNVLLFDDAARKTQKDAVNSVTADTPRTMPKDMGVKPDEQLLDELGIPVAKYDDSQRPTGGERFNERVDSGGSGEVITGKAAYPEDWKSKVTPVDSEKFKSEKVRLFGDYFIPLPELGVGCIVNSETGSQLCYSGSLVDSQVTEGPYFWRPTGKDGPLRAPGLNFISSSSDKEAFRAVHKELESPLNPYIRVDPLEPGQSVQIGNVVCFNLGDRMGCENEKSKFFINDEGGVYLNGSKQPIGAVCGEVSGKTEAGKFSVIVSGGSIDCDEAIKAAAEFLNNLPANDGAEVAPVNLANWSCYAGLRLAVNAPQVLGACRSVSTEPGDFQIWRK